MPICIDFTQLKAHFESETGVNFAQQSVLTLAPNARTQKAIVAGLMENVSEGGVVYSPQILSFSQWVEHLWQTLAFCQPLPSTISGLAIKVWLKDLISKEESWQLTNGLGVAEKVIDAYRNLVNWRISLDQLEPQTPEQTYFINWVRQLEDFLANNNLLADFQRHSMLSDAFDLLSDHLPTHILLVGFNQLTPAEQHLLDKAVAQGTQLVHFYPQRPLQSCQRIQLRDSQQEIELAAAMAKKISLAEPESSVGVVVHQLASQVELIHQYFSEYFKPDEALPWQSLDRCHYNVSAGQALDELPLVNAALKLLKLNASGIDLESLLLLKNTPYIQWGEQRGKIGRFIHEQCLLSLPKYSLNYLKSKIDQDENPQALLLLRQRLTEIESRSGFSKTIGAWSDSWRHSLKSWGWCEQVPLDSAEEKLLTEFRQMFNQVSQLNLVYAKCDQKQASEFFAQLIRQQSFQLPSDRTDVHVLGILEALGLEFDHLILVGFKRENWPQKASINPFIPLDLQRQQSMPGSSAEREYGYAEDASRSLLNSANRILITESLPEQGELTQASGFFESYGLASIDPQTLLKSPTPMTPDYQWRHDEVIDAFQGRVKGGAYLLSQYASCPFKALSQHLLRLKSTEKTVLGVDPKTRGTWLHHALELFWQSVKTQQHLLELTDEQVDAEVDQALVTAEKAIESQLYAGVAAEVVALESAKLKRQILEWLTIEKQRPAFTAATEVEKKLSLAGLDFTFKVDRIDRFDAGGIEIIDYKTGQVDVKKWLGLRPDEAQMPAYVLACEAENAALNIKALSYGKLKTGEVMRAGIEFRDDKPGFEFFEQGVEQTKSKTAGILKTQLIDSEQPIKAQWSMALSQLAENIAAGQMPVSPKDEVESCQYCDYASFCRIKESQPEKIVDSSMVTPQQSSSAGGEK